MFSRQPWTQLSRTHKAPHLNCTCRQAGPSSARLGLEVESEKAQPPKARIAIYLTKMPRKAVVERGSAKTAPPELNLEFRDREFGTTGGHEGRKVSAAAHNNPITPSLEECYPECRNKWDTAMSQRLRVRGSLGAGVCQVFGGAMRLCCLDWGGGWYCHLHTSSCFTQLPDINQMDTAQASNLRAPNPTQPALSPRVSYSFEDRG